MSTLLNSSKTLAEYVLKLSKRNNDCDISFIDKSGNTNSYTSSEYFELIKKVAQALLLEGLQKGDRIALFSNNRIEWTICDLAIACIGCISIPLYPNVTTEELNLILSETESKLIFVENKFSLRQMLLVREQCLHLKKVVVFESNLNPDPNQFISFDEFISSSWKNEPVNFELKNYCNEVRADDPATIIYTSGTTGQPKGVVLNHSQIVSETLTVFDALQINSTDKTLGFLPFSHVLGRTEHWGHLIIGFSMVISSGIEKLQEELPKISPTVIVGVPRIFEKIHMGVLAKIQIRIIDKSLYNWASELNHKHSMNEIHGTKSGLFLTSKLFIANQFILKRIKSLTFGENLRFAICGGAPLDQEIVEFFYSTGILILEGYGLTETTGAICVNRPYDFEFGTVGKPLEKTKIKLQKDGEVLVQGPTVMAEYYKNQESTSLALNNGWFSTGDIGEISKLGNIIIKDRKKDLIKTSNGKFVAPQKLESLFKRLPYISNVHIHGDKKKFVVALITLNKRYIFTEARARGISFKGMEDLIETPFVTSLVREGVSHINIQLASHETVKNYSILSEDFSIERGEITPSLKVKRKVIDQKFSALIDSLYE